LSLNLLLPERIHNEELGNGPHKGKPFKKEDFIEMLQLYYQKRGWDKNGIPGEDTLKRLGLLTVKKSLWIVFRTVKAQVL